MNEYEEALMAKIFIDYYQYFLRGTRTTILVALVTVFLGSILGCLIALMRIHKNKILSEIAKVYITVIRGTPTMVQLLIMWFVVWASARSTEANLVTCAVIAFGMNSGAYIAEIVRSGIMSIEPGQMEAGRSLGLSYGTTMRSVIIPQAFKNILPALGNETITLLKETSIVTVIGLKDLTKGAMIIQGNTFQALVPFFAIAVIYLAMVMILTFIFNRIERRLRESDHR